MAGKKKELKEEKKTGTSSRSKTPVKQEKEVPKTKRTASTSSAKEKASPATTKLEKTSSARSASSKKKDTAEVKQHIVEEEKKPEKTSKSVDRPK
jgi:hypothetical protein